MPKIYPRPESKEHISARTRTSRSVMIAIAVIVALLIVFMLYRIAKGADDFSGGSSPTYGIVSMAPSDNPAS